ncbi:MAG: exodeoxyribonuclease III [Bdellovibrionales bacterium]|nr:exodeoxyribonuclease III [Bdellovibrionales bacterium]
MKIATWNINGFRACFKKGLLDFLQKNSPELVCLQETKAHPDQLTKEQKKIYPFEYWSSCGTKKGYSGTLILSQKPALNISYGMGIKKFDWEGRILIFEHEKFVLLNIYFPNGALTQTRHLFKQEFLKRLPVFLEELKQKVKKELIIVGDYNVAYKEFDVHDPKTLKKTSGFLPEERKWFEDFLTKGYIDVYRHFYPNKKDVYTWWSLREKARANNKGWRIDHICLTPYLIPCVKSINILDKQLGSDHCPVLMEIDF